MIYIYLQYTNIFESPFRSYFSCTITLLTPLINFSFTRPTCSALIPKCILTKGWSLYAGFKRRPFFLHWNSSWNPLLKQLLCQTKKIVHSHYKSNEQLSESIFDLIKFPHIDKLFVPWMSSMLAKDLDSQHFHHLINNIELCNTYTENFFIKKNYQCS